MSSASRNFNFMVGDERRGGGRGGPPQAPLAGQPQPPRPQAPAAGAAAPPVAPAEPAASPAASQRVPFSGTGVAGGAGAGLARPVLLREDSDPEAGEGEGGAEGGEVDLLAAHMAQVRVCQAPL